MSVAHAVELEDLADRIWLAGKGEVEAALRRAALRLRNRDEVRFEPDLEARLAAQAKARGISRKDLIGAILVEWLNDEPILPKQTMGC
jgi:hypothetical protein